jgi:hypothetical protein
MESMEESVGRVEGIAPRDGDWGFCFYRLVRSSFSEGGNTALLKNRNTV